MTQCASRGSKKYDESLTTTRVPAKTVLPDMRQYRPRSTKRGPTGIAGGSSYAPVRPSYQPRPSRRMYGLTSAFLLPAARKRASGVWDAQLFSEFILGQLMPDVLSYLCLILTHRIDIVTTAPELLRYLNFSPPNCSYIIRLLFPFKYPTNADTLIFGDISRGCL